MICIKKITDNDFNNPIISIKNPRRRYSARGLVFNDKGEIAILYKKKKNEYKLIGGGMLNDEKPYETFKREALEETGCEININKCLGTIEEVKSHDNFIQISYVYVSHVIKNNKKLYLTQQEIAEKSICLWLNIEDAIKCIHDCEDKLIASNYDGEMSIYHTKFIVRRDYEILKYYIDNKKSL